MRAVFCYGCSIFPPLQNHMATIIHESHSKSKNEMNTFTDTFLATRFELLRSFKTHTNWGGFDAVKNVLNYITSYHIIRFNVLNVESKSHG